MLNLILVEAALETVPQAIWHHPSVRRSAKRLGKGPSEILLDRSLHHAAMRGLPNGQKRGRPDIVHICLLEALGAPLNREGELRVWVHTVGGYAIEVEPEVRLPRDCRRFNSLMGQLFAEGRVPPRGEKPLLTLHRMDLAGLMERVKASRTVALTSHGRPTTLEEVCRSLSEEGHPAVFVGAYPSGPMEEETLALADDDASIYPEALEAWVVASRLIYEFERTRRRPIGAAGGGAP
ncbi:MAG: 16S rRNA methyltransferase [Candidatus Bathyarchaeia archaeon]